LQTVAVTGAAGFIGSAVVRKLLAKGRKVRALIEPNSSTKNLDELVGQIEKISVDVCDLVSMRRALDGCDTLYHLAAIYKTWTPRPELLYRVNVEGTTTVLLAAQEAQLKKVVYTSSVAAVGLRAGGTPSDEATEFNLFDIANEYILTKHLSEKIALRFAASGLPLVVVNPGFPFGERDSAPTPTGKIILSVLRKEVPGYTTGGFCAIDVEDVAEGHLLAEEKGRVGERYILAHHNISWKGFLTMVSKVAGLRPPLLPVPSFVASLVAQSWEWYADHISHQEPLATHKSVLYATRHAYFDNFKARQELGVPVTPLQQSIERAVGYFRDHRMV
jgi:dihydroflavonol-4-reductase